MPNTGPAVPPGLDPNAEEVGGAYVTVSQRGESLPPQHRLIEREREQRVWNADGTS